MVVEIGNAPVAAVTSLREVWFGCLSRNSGVQYVMRLTKMHDCDIDSERVVETQRSSRECCTHGSAVATNVNLHGQGLRSWTAMIHELM